jgi:hypothetical protein
VFLDWREAAATTVVAVEVLGSAFAIGGVHSVTVFVLLAVAIAGLVADVLELDRKRSRLATHHASACGSGLGGVLGSPGAATADRRALAGGPGKR